MVSQQLEALAAKIETEAPLSEGTATAALAAFGKLRPESSGTEAHRTEDLRSLDLVLHLVDRTLPGWSIHLDGTAHEPNGHWTCQLHPSSPRDDYEFIGHGKGASLANVLLAALLRVLAYLESRDVR